MASVLSLWNKMQRRPLGAWLFSRLICFKAPYFGSISPRFTLLEPGRCEARIRDRRALHNHLGTVHAIALCNLAELTAGIMTEASLPAGMRWIPKGMSVQYLKKARGSLRGIATPNIALVTSETGYELPVNVDVLDAADEKVFNATISMWLSPASKRPA